MVEKLVYNVEGGGDEIGPRLVFEEPIGWYQYGKIPLRIRYNIETPTSDKINERNPGLNQLTPDLKISSKQPSISLSVWVHESVPANFKDIVMFHELKEAELLIYEYGWESKKSHEEAKRLTQIYAKTYLTEDKFAEFIEWQKTLNNY